jgi:DnaJ-like protein
VARKLPCETWESFAERQIREAQEAGEFDGLPGSGQPLPGLDEPYDEFWWIKRKLRHEELSFVPDALAIRREAEALRERLRSVSAEDEARSLIEALNERIARLNATSIAGPPTTVAPMDVEEELRRWRSAMAPGACSRPLG